MKAIKNDNSAVVDARRPALSAEGTRDRWEAVLFFSLYFLYAWLAIDPRLIHQSLGIFTRYYPFTFSTGWSFFLQHAGRVGGATEYLARLLSEGYCFGWLGALILTAAALCTYLGTSVVIRAAGRRPPMAVLCVPAVLLLVVSGAYNHPLNAVLSLLAALLAFALYERLSPETAAKRVAIIAVASVVVYCLAGPGGLLFAVLACVYELLVRRQVLTAAVAGSCAAGVPWAVGVQLFGLGPGDAYVGRLIADPGVLPQYQPYVVALYLFFPVTMAGAAVLQALAGRASRRAKRKPRTPGSGRGARIRRFAWQGESSRAVKFVALCLAAGSIAWFTRDRLGRIVLLVDYECRRERWSEAIGAARRMPPGVYNTRLARNVLLALYHTGRLGDEMFEFPQTSGVDLYEMPAAERDPHSYYQEARFFLELGWVNQAEKRACEALVMTGNQPAILELLATVNVVKDRPEAARIFLNALARDPLYRKRATELLRRLDEDPSLADSERISAIRRSMPTKDNVETTVQIESCLVDLLEANPGNRMAFDFLMAHYLCAGRPGRVVENIRRLPEFGYQGIPRHFQEAIVVHASAVGNPALIGQYGVSPEVQAETAMFSDIMTRASSKEEMGARAIEAGLGGTYFFYFTFGASGL